MVSICAGITESALSLHAGLILSSSSRFVVVIFTIGQALLLDFAIT